MDIAAGSLRGMGYSVTPMIVSLLGACGLRILWVLTVFAAHPTTGVLYISYPISWSITFSVLLISFVVIYKKQTVTKAE